ncbi:MAG: ATP-binding protein [Prevotellaceae bacterium]|jgi:AAA+ ATPase superfamily predicted ATPase|nr:ATP-binding protein [Prevotellaceae bacterium]
MKSNIIGRVQEQRRLVDLYNSSKPEFAAVYGRRRVGKTFLIRETFKEKFFFDMAGLANSNIKEQLTNFTISLNKVGLGEFSVAKSWIYAFEDLITVISKSKEKRKIIFIDEIPWLDTHCSRFLAALEHFWNGWACARKDVFLIVCGSATSWIINKLINNHGGLHNRITASIFLEPFTLKECEKYLKSQKIKFSQYQIAECYMILGGIPFYLSKIKKELSLSQNIDFLFFDKFAELKSEFKNLYKSLFRDSEEYMKIVEALSKKSKGLTRQEISKATKISTGGGFTTMLENLENSGFIRSYSSFGKRKRDILYQLIDSFTLFYFKYLSNNEYNDTHFWTNSENTPQQNAWAGFAFEILVLQHIREVKEALGIAGIQASVASWRNSKGTKPAAQIDLIIDRKDGLTDLCEIKFSKSKFTINKEYDEKLRNKVASLISETKTQKAVHLLMLTTYGVTKNKYYGTIQKEITLADLFK